MTSRLQCTWMWSQEASSLPEPPGLVIEHSETLLPIMMIGRRRPGARMSDNKEDDSEHWRYKHHPEIVGFLEDLNTVSACLGPVFQAAPAPVPRLRLASLEAVLHFATWMQRGPPSGLERQLAKNRTY